MKLIATLLIAFVAIETSAQTPRVIDHLGLQMYSVRETIAHQGWGPALQQTRDFGLTAIESGTAKGMTLEQFKTELDQRGMKMIGAGFSYETLTQDLDNSVKTANTMGSQYAELTWIPHQQDNFTEEEALKAAADFNRWGEAFAKQGVIFVYHPHGYEFRPRPDGETLFDLIVKKTDPTKVSFEMDVFWVTHAGQNPVALLAKYPDRWRTMHIKDIAKGAPTGIYTGHAPAADDVPVGQGQVNWPAVLNKAKAIGVKWYFLEDESTDPNRNIPQSLAYLNSLGL